MYIWTYIQNTKIKYYKWTRNLKSSNNYTLTGKEDDVVNKYNAKIDKENDKQDVNEQGMEKPEEKPEKRMYQHQFILWNIK